jgi:HEAT repeat protein
MTAKHRLIQELRAAGIPVEGDLQELYSVQGQYSLVVPILVRWLDHIDQWSDRDDTHGRLEDAIVRALCYPNLRSQARRLAVPAVVNRFRECSDNRRWVVGYTLARIAGPKFHDDLIPLIQDPRYGGDRSEIVLATYRWNDPRVTPMLIPLLDDGSVAAFAASSLGRMGAKEATIGLIALARNGTDYQRSEAVQALTRIWTAPEALKLATDPGNELAGKVLVKELWRWKDPAIVRGLIQLLDNPDLAADAARSLGRLKAKDAEYRLSELTSAGTREQRRAAESALRRISPPPKDPNKPHPDDWYRNPRWDEAAREIFETKLARARGDYSRAQYLKLKALSLTSADGPETIAAGRMLFGRVVEEYSDELSEVEGAYFGLAESFAREGRYEEAIWHFEKSLETANRRSIHSARYGTEVCLAEAIVDGRLAHRYDRALRGLAEYDENHDFDLNDWRWRKEVAWARLLERKGDRAGAAKHARSALKLLGLGPQFYRHPDVGLVEAHATTVKEMEKLAGGWLRVLRG